jgi:Putative transposase of IS4/5 family (DUF4096)
LTLPEVRRLRLALAEPHDRFGFRRLWSTWRRHHQAVARRCPSARHGRRYPPVALPAPEAVGLAMSPELPDDQGARVSHLLPAQRPPGGRPPEDHRTILAGMLWIVRTGAAWRTLPATCGPWPTVSSRYRRWRQAGIWQRLLEPLDPTQPPLPPKVAL